METGLYYNRFRYYDPEDGVYVSQDPIRLGGNLNLFAYVADVNAWLDVFGLVPAWLAKLFGKSGIYTIKSGNQAYGGSAIDAGERLSQKSHEKVQDLLKNDDVIVEFTEVDLGNADTRRHKQNILRHFEQQELDDLVKSQFELTNEIRAEAPKKKTRNSLWSKLFGAKKKGKKVCN